ncbi:hypothetical protein QM012_000913 [Aureobasidium pullulans]|uniref:Uncharacterized protein n=1 Tax=Aureobasidium pullulans TaxID=5580 RepID=A0ABR0TF62_AURPU
MSSSSSTSLLDLYLLHSSSCINAGNNTTLPSSTVMDGQAPSKGVRKSSGSTTLSTLESLVEAYAASERSDVSPAFIHAGDLDRQSYVDARGELAVERPSLPASGPAPSLLLPPPPPARRPPPYIGEDESDEAVPTPPTRILDRAPPPSVSRFLSGLDSGVFDAEESDHDSVSAMGQQEEDTSVFGEVKVSQPYETSFDRYNLFPDVGLAPRLSRSDSTMPQPPSHIHFQPSSPSLASTVPLNISGYDDDQGLMLQRQTKSSPRRLENPRTHSLSNDSAWLQRDKEGKRRSWTLFVVCAIFPFILFLFAFGVFDKVMVQMAGTHARPTLRQKSLAKYLCVVEVVAWPSLAA